MEELRKHLEEEGWTKFMVSKIDGKETTVLHHDKSKFSIWLTDTKFQFKSHWKMIRFSTDWITYHSLDHFEIFDKQARELDTLIFRYL